MKERLDHEMTVFSAARRLPAAARAAYLDEACAGDAVLRERVEELLGASEEAGEFLQDLAPGSTLRVSAITEKAGDKIGRYKLLQQIGEGGCGVVYMAEQEQPVRRRVALKVIKLGMDTKNVIARFEAERQALALMDHPNIAKVLDAGATDTGRPYFVMELVKGVRITDYCDEHNLSTKARLDLFIQVCQAIQHAHQKGIIHRDIKPSNILVTMHDGVPVPKVIDFGIAKATDQRLTDKTLFTAFEQLIGTPAYMSPEQAEMRGLDIDTRSDIYALGVLLYELLTGKTPFDGRELLASGLDAMRRTIREQEPARPSTRLTQELERTREKRLPLPATQERGEGGGRGVADGTSVDSKGASSPRPSAPSDGGEGDSRASARRLLQIKELIPLLRGDLDWIVMKALEKDRMRRYETANGLAADITRHLNDEPVVARPPSRIYQFQKTVRRHTFAFAAAATVILVLAGGITLTTWQAVRATRAERAQTRLLQRAEEAGDLAKRQEQLAIKNAEEARRQQGVAFEQELLARRRFYAAQMNLAMQASDVGDLGRTLDLLETQRPDPGKQDLRNFEWYHLWGLCNANLRQTLTGHNGQVMSVAFSADGKMLASGGRDGTIRLWDSASGHELGLLRPTVPAGVPALAFTPDGKTLAAGSWDHLVRLWDVPAGQLRKTLSGHVGWVRCLAVSPDGKSLVTAGEDGVKLWNLPDGSARASFAAYKGSTILSLVFFGDNTTLAIGSDWGPERGFVSLWDVTQSPPQQMRRLAVRNHSLTLSPDGKTLATAAYEGIFLGNTSTGQPLPISNGLQSRVNAVMFLPDGKTLASCSQDRTLRLWQLPPDSKTNGENRIIGTHLDSALCLAVAPDGLTLASGANDGSVKLWNVGHGQERAEKQLRDKWQFGAGRESVRLSSLFFSPDGSTLVGVIDHATVGKDTVSGAENFDLPGAGGRGALSSDGKLLATGDRDGTLKLWDRSSGRLLASVSAHSKSINGGDGVIGAIAVAFSADGRNVATSSFEEGTVRIWDTALKKIRSISHPVVGVTALGFSPNGKRLAVAVRFNYVLLYDDSTGRLERTLRVENGFYAARAITFSPQGELLATGSDTGVVKLWDVETGQLRATMKGHTDVVQAVAFSPDGTTLATGSDDLAVRLWDVATGQECGAFKGFRHPVLAVAFSPDGTVLAAGTSHGEVSLWRGNRLVEAELKPVPMEQDVRLLTSGFENSYAWDLATSDDPQARDGAQAVELAQKAVAATNRKNPQILDTLAAAYAETGDFTNAVHVQQEAIALLQNEEQKKDCTSRLRLYESNRPYRDHGRLAERANALLAEGKLAEAEPLARECLAIRETMIPDDWLTFDARRMLGGCLLGQKKFTEAESLLISGYEGMKQREDKIPPAGKARPQQALRRLVQLYEATDRLDQAAEWKKKLAALDKTEK